MPKQRMSLPMIKDVIRLKWHARLSHESIAITLKVSKGVVAKYVGLASAAGLDWETVQDWSEQRLSTALLPRSTASQPFVEPDWGRIHRELDRKGMTLMLLWQEYVAAHPEQRTWRYTQFCEHYKTFTSRLKRSMRQHRRAGEKLFIDFAGPTVGLSDGSRAQVFVSAMAASSYVFACATPAQRLERRLRRAAMPAAHDHHVEIHGLALDGLRHYLVSPNAAGNRPDWLKSQYRWLVSLRFRQQQARSQTPP